MGRSGVELLEALEVDWRLLASSRAARNALTRWRRLPGLRRLRSLDEVLEQTRKGADPARANDVLGALVACAPVDRVAARVVLQALLPGLTNVGKRMRVLGDEERTAELVALAFERIRTYPLERRPRAIAANVVLDVLHALWSQQRAARRSIEQAADPGRFEALADEPADAPDPDPRELIASARAAGRVHDTQLALVEEAVVNRVPARVAAKTAGVDYEAMKRRRSRARRQLALACAGT